MGERTEELARLMEDSNSALIAFVESLTDEQWRRTCADEQWSVGVVANHIANGYDQDGRVAAMVRVIVEGTLPPPPWPPDYNDANAKRFVGRTRAETLDYLRRNGAAAARLIRELGDTDLDRTFTSSGGRPPRRLGDMLEYVLIGHAQEHLASMRNAIAVG